MMYKVLWLILTQFYRLAIREIGLFSYIAPISFLLGGKLIHIGNYVRIFSGLRIEAHDNGKIVIEDNVGIAQNVHISSCQNALSIGANTTILANAFITNFDHCYTELGVNILRQKNLCKITKIGEYCLIGYGAAIQAGTILGRQCIVGANSVVRGTFPDYCVIVGAPARIVKRYNEETGTWQSTDSQGTFI